jgi:hypothetical protein
MRAVTLMVVAMIVKMHQASPPAVGKFFDHKCLGGR